MRSDEVDLGAILARARRRWILIVGLGFLGVALSFLFTFLIPAQYEAKANIVFPAQSRGPSLDSLGLDAVAGSENMGLVEGIVASRDVENELVKLLEIDRESVRESLSIAQIPARRQVAISFRAKSKNDALKAVEVMLEKLRVVEDEIGVNTSAKRLDGLRKAHTEKKEIVEKLENEIVAFQRSALTVPDPDDGFTGVSYLKNQAVAQRNFESINKRIESRKQAAKKLGRGAAEGLPTGLESEEKWRDDLLQASIVFDRVRSKYQPGTPEVVEAEQKLEATRKNIIQEVQKYVSSVEGGVDQEIAQLIGEKTVLQWELDRANKLAKQAPSEATEYRRLLDRLQLEKKIRDELKSRADQEQVRFQIEAKIWQVLDPPFVDDDPVNKKYGLNGGLGLILGSLLGAVLANRASSKP